MWFLLICALFFMPVFAILQTPPEWWNNKKMRIVLLIFHSIGTISTVLLLCFFHLINNPFLRETIVFIETAYFSPKYLTDEEKSDLDKVQKEIVYFTSISESWKDFISARCPIYEKSTENDTKIKI